MATIFSKINSKAVNISEVLPVGDDLIICLDTVVGEAVAQDPNLVLEIGLFVGDVLQGSYIPIDDGLYGNDFAAGKVTGVIQNSVTDTLARGTYRLALRAISGTGATELTKTYKLFANYVLVA